MKKTILFIAFLCGLFSLTAQNAIDTTNQAVLKYASEDIVSACGAEESQVVYGQSAAIRLTQKQLVAYKDNYVIKMMVGLAKHDEWTPDTVQGLKFWIREKLTGENLWEQEYDTAKIEFGAWNELVFDEFFALDGASDLYFGYTITCGGLPIAGDGNIMAADPNATHILDVSANKWIQYSSCGNFCIKVVIAGENMPAYNLAINALRTAEFVRPDSKFDAVANISNTVDKDINSFDFVIYANDKEVYRKTETLSKALKNGEALNIFFKDIQLTEEGQYDVVYTIESLNGSNSDDSEDDSKQVVKTNVSNEFENKVVMLEMFSGTLCSNCPTGHKYLHEATDKLGTEKYVWAIHHAGYNASELTVDESGVAVAFYGAQTTYAPGTMLDRVNLLDVGVTTSTGATGPVFSVNEVGSRGVLEDYMEVIQKNMSPIALDVDFTLDSATRELNVIVNGELLGDFDAKGLRVGVITIEDGISGTQAGHAGKYTHTHIIRSFLTSAYGSIITVEDGVFSKDFSQVLKEKFVLDNMRLAVWVGKNGRSSDINTFEIYQAYEVKLNDNPYTPVEYVSDNSQLVIYQEGDMLHVKGIDAGDVLSVYAMDGKLMMQKTADAETAQFELTSLTKGTYLLQTNGSYVKFVK
ncbi:MAG: Omp28-related outer membrane protein [Paludibacteraceae bacterium]|nr:Omp28-related outer membrane protein [Paludibacteraceae bacterium]